MLDRGGGGLGDRQAFENIMRGREVETEANTIHVLSNLALLVDLASPAD